MDGHITQPFFHEVLHVSRKKKYCNNFMPIVIGSAVILMETQRSVNQCLLTSAGRNWVMMQQTGHCMRQAPVAP
jgi:hypothetical protein